MQSDGTFLAAGWDVVDERVNGTEDIWWILEGQGYPRLRWELTEGNAAVDTENRSGINPLSDDEYARYKSKLIVLLTNQKDYGHFLVEHF